MYGYIIYSTFRRWARFRGTGLQLLVTLTFALLHEIACLFFQWPQWELINFLAPFHNDSSLCTLEALFILCSYIKMLKMWCVIYITYVCVFNMCI